MLLLLSPQCCPIWLPFSDKVVMIIFVYFLKKKKIHTGSGITWCLLSLCPEIREWFPMFVFRMLGIDSSTASFFLCTKTSLCKTVDPYGSQYYVLWWDYSAETCFLGFGFSFFFLILLPGSELINEPTYWVLVF